MKRNSTILLALGAALFWIRGHRAAGVGRVRRNIFAEIDFLQKSGIPLGSDFNLLTEHQKSVVAAAANRGYKQPAASRNAGVDWREAYYKSISRQYLKLVNPAIGRIQYPHTTSVIRNSRGDVVLTYNDYDPEQDWLNALDWYSDKKDTYSRIVYQIAIGNKFAWESKKTASGARYLTGVKDAIYGGKSHPEEKKELRQILSSKGSGIEQYAEIYGADNGSMDDYNAVCDAIRDFHTPKAAKEYILEQYYQTFDDGTPEEPEDYDLPF